MEYFDAIVVITSLAIDIYFLHGEKKIHGKKLIIFTIRLWRFVRIISSVGEGFRDAEREHKQRLNKEYLAAVQRLVDLLVHKTNYVEQKQDDDNTDMNSILEHFRIIDSECQSSLEKLNDNHKLPSTLVVAQFLEEIERLENKDKNSIISAMFGKSPEV